MSRKNMNTDGNKPTSIRWGEYREVLQKASKHFGVCESAYAKEALAQKLIKDGFIKRPIPVSLEKV